MALASEPAGLAKMRQSSQSGIVERVRRIEALYYWPGKAASADTVAAAQVQALPPAAKASFDRGREIYTTICGA